MAAVTRRQYKGAAASTTTASSLSISDTSVTLTATTGWPSTAAVPFYVVIDPGTSSEEKCSATISGSTLTLTRAADDTTAVAHSSGATIYPVFSADEADEANNMAATMTTKGDLLVTTGSAFNRLAVGTNGYQLTADSVSTNGVKWALSPETDLVTTKGDLLVATAADTLARQAVGANGTVLMADSAQTNGVAWVGGGLSNRNGIINGNMSTWQRGTSFTSVAATYTADRWLGARPGNAVGLNISRQATGDTTNLPTIQYCLRAQRASANANTDSYYIGYSLETTDSIRFAGQTVVLSFYARAGANYSPTSSGFVANIYTGTGTDQNVNSGFTGSANPSSVTHTLTTTWQRFQQTVTLSASATQVGFLFIAAPTGTASTNDYFEITGVQFEAGAVATPFEFENISTTLAKCLRYFWRHTSRTDDGSVGAGVMYSTTAALGTIVFPVPARSSAPTVTGSSNSCLEVVVGGAVLNATTVGFGDTTSYSTATGLTVSGGTTGQGAYIRFGGTNDFIQMSDEL